MAPKTDFAGKDLSGADLRNADFTCQALFQTNLTGAQLFGLRLSMSCATWDGVLLDDDNVGQLLTMIASADMDSFWVDGLKALVVEKLGERRARAIARVMDLAER